ncbi:hypothetical protein LPJ54_006637, partial [Coemansia sp. RSA 1824]
MQLTYNPESLLQLAFRLAAEASHAPGISTEHPTTSSTNTVAPNAETRVSSGSNSVHLLTAPSPGPTPARSVFPTLITSNFQITASHRAKKHSLASLFGLAVSSSTLASPALAAISASPVLPKQVVQSTPMTIVPTLVRVPGAGVIHDVTADLHSTVSNGGNNLTRMLTEKGVVVKITTTVDVLPSMPTQVSVSSATFALPIVPSSTLPANPPPSIFVYTPPLTLAG